MDIKNKFELYSDFVKKELLNHCEQSKELEEIFKIYILSFKLLPAEKLIETIVYGIDRYERITSSKDLYDMYIKSFKIKINELRDRIQFPLVPWCEFIFDIYTQRKLSQK